MARTRVIYQSEAVYCSQNVAYDADQTGATAVKQLDRVQSANYSFSIARQDVNQFGNLAAIDQIITETPTVSFDTSYYLANLTNEERLGFNVLGSGQDPAGFTSCIGNIIDSSNNAYQKNYYLLTTKEGKDANDNTTTGDFSIGASIIGIGNGFLSSYSTEGAVGGLPTVSVSVEGQNMNFVNLPYAQEKTFVGAGIKTGVKGTNANAVTYISGESPAVSASEGVKVDQKVALPAPLESAGGGAGDQISTLRPGDITLTLAKQTEASNTAATLFTTTTGNALYAPDYAGADINDAHIQSYTMSFDLSRSPIQKLGNKFAFARSIDFPINVSLSVDAVLSDLTAGSLADIINCDEKFDARITLKDPACSGPKKAVVNYLVKGLKLDSQSFSSDIGSNKTVTLDFTSQIGGPDQFSHGVFMSGYYNGQ